MLAVRFFAKTVEHAGNSEIEGFFLFPHPSQANFYCFILSEGIGSLHNTSRASSAHICIMSLPNECMEISMQS